MVVPAGRRLIVFIERDEDALSDRLSESLTNALGAQVCMHEVAAHIISIVSDESTANRIHLVHSFTSASRTWGARVIQA